MESEIRRGEGGGTRDIRSRNLGTCPAECFEVNVQDERGVEVVAILVLRTETRSWVPLAQVGRQPLAVSGREV